MDYQKLKQLKYRFNANSKNMKIYMTIIKVIATKSQSSVGNL